MSSTDNDKILKSIPFGKNRNIYGKMILSSIIFVFFTLMIIPNRGTGAVEILLYTLLFFSPMFISSLWYGYCMLTKKTMDIYSDRIEFSGRTIKYEDIESIEYSDELRPLYRWTTATYYLRKTEYSNEPTKKKYSVTHFEGYEEVLAEILPDKFQIVYV